MVVIVRSLAVPASELDNLNRIPSVEELRPSHCPSCHAAAGVPGARNLVGHGTYRRQVLGLVDAGRSLVIYVRRFLCLACERTVSILPDELLPWRWYAGTAILTALVLSVLQGVPAAEVRERLGAAAETPGWKSLERWRRQLLDPLWRWIAGELGFSKCPAAPDDDGLRERLRRLLARFGAHGESRSAQRDAAARAAVTLTAHTRGGSLRLRHAP